VTQAFRVAPLAPAHDRDGFCCGVEALDRYFRDLALEEAKRGGDACFVASTQGGAIAGYYTLALASLPLDASSGDEALRLPRAPLLLVGLLGRLAVARDCRGEGLGRALIMDAAARAARAQPVLQALIVDAHDEIAAAFYRRCEFRRFASRRGALFLPLATALRALRESGSIV